MLVFGSVWLLQHATMFTNHLSDQYSFFFGSVHLIMWDFLDEVNVHGRTSRTYCQRRALYICIRFVFMLSMYMMLPAIAWRTFHDAPYTPSTKHQWKLPNFVSIHTCVVSVNVTALCCATISLPASVLDLLEILVHNTMCLEAF
jgi:hypothetical protein